MSLTVLFSEAVDEFLSSKKGYLSERTLLHCYKPSLFLFQSSIGNRSLFSLLSKYTLGPKISEPPTHKKYPCPEKTRPGTTSRETRGGNRGSQSQECVTRRPSLKNGRN